jgi:hypothetical protein
LRAHVAYDRDFLDRFNAPFGVFVVLETSEVEESGEKVASVGFGGIIIVVARGFATTPEE